MRFPELADSVRSAVRTFRCLETFGRRDDAVVVEIIAIEFGRHGWSPLAGEFSHAHLPIAIDVLLRKPFRQSFG